MRKLYTTKASANNHLSKLMIFAILLIFCALNSYGQVTVPFAPRTSIATPTKTVYTVKGDFSMIGNTNLTLASYGDNINNNNDMIYVDVDNDANTLNSSSATLNFSTENGSIPECANIIYAGLYWTGRAGTSEVFNVTKNGVTKEFNKRKVLLKKETTGTYVSVTANTTSLVNKDIYYPSGTEGNMYSAYAEITDYVKTNGLGEYFVANIATLEGNPDATGYYGGWGMVVVYENSQMKWRDVTVFDGHAYVQGATTANYTFDVNGFNTAQSGPINLKLGVMAGEGDAGISGDYFQIQRQDNGTFQSLSHSSNSTTNFFNSSINTGGNTRNPELVNNTGIDISMFNINNTDNGIITNNQTQTTFKYGSTQDTYVIFNVTFSVDSYVPEVTGVITNTSINGNPNPVPIIIEPGQFAEYKLEIKNAGTEATNNTIVTIPLPDTVNTSDLNINYNTHYTPLSSDYSDPQYDANVGPNGSIIWNLGTLPLPTDSNTVLADISFKLTATTDCSIIGDANTTPTITLFGNISGTGAISNVSFNTPLIQGYSVTDICKDSPIPIPIVIDIDNTNYKNTPPTITAPSPLNIEGCDESTISVATARYPYSSIESADIKDSYITNGYTASPVGSITSITYIDVITQNSNCFQGVTRTFTATNICGSKATVVQIINVNDTNAPVITTEASNLTVECDGSGNTTDLNNWLTNHGGALATDTCSSVSWSNNFSALSDDCGETGTATVTFTATDGCGNASITLGTFTINDNIAPVAPSAPNSMVFECIDDVLAPGNLTAVDNCSGIITVVGIDSVDNSNPCNLIITRNWTFTDTCDNSSSVAQVIIVKDTKAPVAPSSPTDMTYQCINDVPVPGNLTAVDNCIGNITVAGVDSIDNSNPCNVIITRTWTFTDKCGNSSASVQTLTVKDTIAPELTSNLDTEMNVSCANIPDVPNLTFADNCASNVDVVYDETNTFDETILQDYEIIRTWTVGDACGNKNVYTQTLHVALDEIVTEINTEDRCFDDGVINLNDYLQVTNLNGNWEMIEGNPIATLEGNIFDPTTLQISLDFNPSTNGIPYKFRYTITDNGCISITNVSMIIDAKCVVLPCGSDDVVISKAITPNGDQWNEYFQISGVELCGFVIDVKLFNRWGALVYQSENYQNNWNGIASSGSLGDSGTVPNGTYYYIVILKNSGLNPFTGPVYVGTK